MKYWAYINNEILGPYEKEKLFELPVFTAATLICPQTPVGEKTQDWKEASTYPEVAALLSTSGASAAPAAGSSPAPLPKPDAVGSEPKLERPAPVFNTEMPESKLKPLSLHTIDQAPPAAAPHIEGANFGVGPLGEAKGLPKPDPLQSAPSFTSANFKPMTLSQIGKRADVQTPGATPTGESMSTLSQTFEATAPAPVPARQSPAAAGQGADNNSLGEITSRLDALARAALTKQDIDPLREKLGQMGEVISSMKNGQFQRDIMDKMQHLENSISDIKASLSLMPSAAPARAAQSPQFAAIESNSASMMASQPGRIAPAKPAEPVKAEKQGSASGGHDSSTLKPLSGDGITDQGSSGKTSKLIAVMKKIVRLLLTLVLLAAVLGGAAFYLKQFGVFDVTKFLPFRIPYLSSPQAEPEIAAPQPFPEEAQAVAKETGQTGEAQQAPAEPPKKELSPEIIYIGRTYTAKPGGETLENMIYRDAAVRKGDFNKTTWQVKELSGSMFELDGVMPLKDNSGQLVYRYEVDYARKSVKPLDGMSKKPMDALLNVRAAAQPDRSKTKKGRKAAGAATRPAAAKPAKAKPAPPADDEYEYVYEEEAGGTEE